MWLCFSLVNFLVCCFVIICCFWFFFFFQAEDGIRDRDVTGVQTCALPISGDVRYGATGKPVPGYQLRLVDERGEPVQRGEIGELQVSGPTSAAYYWNNREKTDRKSVV